MASQIPEITKMLSRKTLCLASQAPGFTLHDGDDIFLKTVSNHYSSAENNAAEKLMKLKRNIAPLPTDQFWRVLLPGIADILKAEYITIAKRILPDDPNSVVEMPAIGEPGSCFNAVALYINDGKSENLVTDYSYATFGGACAQMRYDKVFLVPHSLAKYMPTRVAEFTVIPESYIGIPLFFQDKCFGHIACVWSDESTFKDSGLTWGFTEMMLHALEDVISDRLLEGSSLKPTSAPSASQQIIPQSAIVATQSLKPYARSLSHELRTPMQTMVGGMDLIGASLDDMLGCTTLEEAFSQIMKTRALIDEFQDSSRRAVRAADNVVQAYDLDMQVPDRPHLLEEESEENLAPPSPIMIEQNSANFANFAAKRKRIVGEEEAVHKKPKRPPVSTNSSVEDLTTTFNREHAFNSIEGHGIETPPDSDGQTRVQAPSPTTSNVGFVHIRDFVSSEVNDLIHHGETRPIAVQVHAIDHGERINITNNCPDGSVEHKILEWEVQPSVPTEIVIEEKELSKTFTAVIANALKFTDDGGHIRVDIRLSPRLKYVVFTIKDNGCGIPESFQPRLFQAFSREDESITRHNEGLGLGLLVAKGNARKIGGDLFLIKSSTSGTDRGSHFELKIPISPSETNVRQDTPSRPATPGRLEMPPTPFDLESTSMTAPRRGLALKLALDDQHGSSPTPEQLLTPGSPSEQFGKKLAAISTPRSRTGTNEKKAAFDRQLGTKYPHRILVAEDSSLNRRLIVSMLSKLGYNQVIEAFDGKEAVRLMEEASTKDDHVDLILMDIWMPNMDGYEATQRILAMNKAQQSQKSLKILAVTADITDTALGRAKEVGMVGCMTKPFRVLDLERLIIEHSQPSVDVA